MTMRMNSLSSKIGRPACWLAKLCSTGSRLNWAKMPGLLLDMSISLLIAGREETGAEAPAIGQSGQLTFEMYGRIRVASSTPVAVTVTAVPLAVALADI